MNDTVFGKIIRGEIPSTKVYEDENFFAFLDINPVRKGHTLLLPKKQYAWMQDVPDETLSTIFVLAKHFMKTMKETLACDYVQIVVEGIQVPHFHIHLIPSNNEEKNAVWQYVQYEDGEMTTFGEKIRNGLEK